MIQENNFLNQSQILKTIRKRDGRVVPFDASRIESAVFKAFEAQGQPNREIAAKLTQEVIEKLVKKHKRIKQIPTIEEVQDLVEEILVEAGYAKIAKAYILYREKRGEIRREKQEVLNKEEIDEVDKKFDINALRVLVSRYLRKDENGKAIESPKQLFTRVALQIGLADILFDQKVAKKIKGALPEHKADPDYKKFDIKEAENLEGKLKVGKYSLNKFHIQSLHLAFTRFHNLGLAKIDWDKLVLFLKQDAFKNYEETVNRYYDLMVSKKFLPNTPTLANFGASFGMGSACFVLGIEDSMESIMETLKQTAFIHQAGGGTGFYFGNLRPEGDFVNTTAGTASGPISFMRLYDFLTDVIKQGGMRRGANMGILPSDSPDIEKFVTAKQGNQALRNFNISILIKPEFWECYEKNKPYPLVNPRTGKIVRYISARSLWDRIIYQAWESAEPGVIFYDHLNKYNPFLKSLGPLTATNPCGEQPLYQNESCNLGSINLWNFVKENSRDKKVFDWQEFEKTIRLATRFLNNVIDINRFPLPKIEEMTFNTRKIGLGLMGLSELLFELELPYNSPSGRKFMEKIAEFLNYYSKLESIELAKTRGSFPYFNKSFYSEGKMPFSAYYDKKSWNLDWSKIAPEIKKHGLRNSLTTTIAPSGTISMIASTSSGIEPVYSIVFQKNTPIGSFYYVDPVFERVMSQEGLFDEVLIKDVVANKGSIQKIHYIPSKFKKYFLSAYDIAPEDHIYVLAAFSKWIDNAISKTNNLPANAATTDVEKSYLLAYKLGIKDVTIYRDSSIKGQTLVVEAKKKEKKEESVGHLVSIKDEKAGGPAIYHAPAGSDAKIIAASAENGETNIVNYQTPQNCPQCQL